MTTLIVGRRHIPLQEVALVEPFDPLLHPGMKSDRPFKARIVLLDRQSVLTEDPVETFVQAHGFRALAEDAIAINPAIRFAVETFAPARGFEPNKPYQSRLQWRDLAGETQSKLLLGAPDAVLAIAAAGVDRLNTRRAVQPRSLKKRQRARRAVADPEPA